MNLIVAVDAEWGIGYKNDLLARVRADLQNFRKTTQGKVVVYGFNTLATFPGGKGLKNRTNIVLTRKKDFSGENIIVANSIDHLTGILKNYDSSDVFVIGGESIYRQLVDMCDTAYVTKFYHSFNKDAYMPNLDQDPSWVCTETGEPMYSDGQTDSIDGMEYRFLIYKKAHANE